MTVKTKGKTYADECLERADHVEKTLSVQCAFASMTDVVELARRLKRACAVLREANPKSETGIWRQIADELEAMPNE